MSALTMTKHYEAPIDAVFAVYTDIDHWADYIGAIVRVEKLTDGPLNKGTRWRETRMMFRKEATEEMEVIAFEPGRSYTVGCESCGCECEWSHRFAPDGTGTRVEMSMEYRPISFLAKIMSPIGKLMMGSMMKKCIEKDFEDLRAVLEPGNASPVNA